jgi:hypothetical protein
MLMVVTIDGAGLTTGLIGFQYSYSVPTTVDLHTRLHFTVFSGNGSSAYVPLHCLLSAESLQGPGPPADPTLLFSSDDSLSAPTLLELTTNPTNS